MWTVHGPYPSPRLLRLTFPWPEIHANDTNGSYTSSRQDSLTGFCAILLVQWAVVISACWPRPRPEICWFYRVFGEVCWLRYRSSCSFRPLVDIGSVAGHSNLWIESRRPPVRLASGTYRSGYPVTETGDELQRLAETCNAMLDRLESA